MIALHPMRSVHDWPVLTSTEAAARARDRTMGLRYPFGEPRRDQRPSPLVGTLWMGDYG
jgi:hypothetical protein